MSSVKTFISRVTVQYCIVTFPFYSATVSSCIEQGGVPQQEAGAKPLLGQVRRVPVADAAQQQRRPRLRTARGALTVLVARARRRGQNARRDLRHV